MLAGSCSIRMERKELSSHASSLPPVPCSPVPAPCALLPAPPIPDFFSKFGVQDLIFRRAGLVRLLILAYGPSGIQVSSCLAIAKQCLADRMLATSHICMHKSKFCILHSLSQSIHFIQARALHRRSFRSQHILFLTNRVPLLDERILAVMIPNSMRGS
jgi:hypothetical protein